MLKLTAEEKIAINLGSYNRFKDEVEAPFETTQAGLSLNLDLRRSHVSIALSGLKRKGMVFEHLSHVKGSVRRKKTYFLTEKGVRFSDSLKKRLEDEIIIFKDGSREEKMKLKSLVDVLPTRPNLTEVLVHIENDVFDSASFKSKGMHKGVDYSSSLPEIRYFFGRESELERLNNFMDSTIAKIFALKGIAGIGKTTLLARFAADLKPGRYFSYRICEWTTLRNVLNRLSNFLRLRNRMALSAYLKPKDVPDIDDAVELMIRDLAGINATLIFDDVHNASENLIMLLRAIVEGLERVDDAKLIISGRTIPPIYSRKDVRVKGTVSEMRLKGLDRESALKVLKAQREGDEQHFPAIYRLTKGHPLFLELLATNGAVSFHTDVKRYIDEEINSRLNSDEKKVLYMASVFRFPIKSQGLLEGLDVDRQVLEDLSEKSLLHCSEETYEMHEITKEFFYERMSVKKRKRNHLSAAHYYKREDEPLAVVESIYHLIKADETVKASRRIIDDGMELISKGYHEELLEVISLLYEKNIGKRDWIRIIFLKGEILTMQGDWKGAQDCLKEALYKSRMARYKEGLTQSQYELGVMHYRKGEWTKALERYEKALGLSKEGGFREREAKLYNTIGIVFWRKGEFSKAEEYYKKSIEIYKKLKDNRGVAGGYNNLGIVHWELKEIDKALEYYNKALRISVRMDDKRTIAILYNNIGEVYRIKGDKQKALRYFEDSLELSEALEFKWQIAEIHRNLGRLSRGNKRREHLEMAFKLFKRLGAKKDLEEVRKMLKK